MTDRDPRDAARPSFWTSPRFSWGLVFLSLGLAMLSGLPSLLEQLARVQQGLAAPDPRALGLVLAFAAPAVLGLWRLAAPRGLPRLFAFLYPLFPVAVIAVYLLKPFLDRVRTRR